MNPASDQGSPEPMSTVLGQPSWELSSDGVTAWVTRLGGHLAPVEFHLQAGVVQPYAVAPWAEEPGISELPALMQSMRGDFFCLPFGHAEEAYRGEQHPPHGETANARWQFVGQEQSTTGSSLHLALDTTIRPGHVDKHLFLRSGHTAIYCQHLVSGMAGPMNLGHHPNLKFPGVPGCGRLSYSPFQFGQVYPGDFERPENHGYSFLLPGGKFHSLAEVPARTGTVDLSRYPARRGYEDLVMLVTDPTPAFAWTAVTFPEQGYVWFSLKDPRVLQHSVLWFSNGGRHYPPWNGRHVDVLGLEEVTSYFHTGVGPSTDANPLNSAGHATTLALDPAQPLTVNFIMAMHDIPAGFDEVRSIEATPGGVTLRSASGLATSLPLDSGFIANGKFA